MYMTLAGKPLSSPAELNVSSATIGLKEILSESNICNNVLRIKFCKASDMVKSSALSEHIPLNVFISTIVRKFGEKILLKESDKVPRSSRRKAKRQSSLNANHKGQFDSNGDWQGPPPWDLSLGGDGCPKFLCDVMVRKVSSHVPLHIEFMQVFYFLHVNALIHEVITMSTPKWLQCFLCD